MYEDIKKNKIKTGFIISIFILMITLIVYYICMSFNLGTISIIIALTFSILSSWCSYYFSDKIVLSLNGARLATPEENKKLINILDGLMISSGLEYRPRLYIVESSQPNAFATGRNPKNAVVCVTTGLLEKLDYYELEGVIAHELGHIKNYDILLSAVVTVMVGFIVMLSDLMSRRFYLINRKDNDSNSKGNFIIMILGFICLILGPVFAQLMKLALSRRREFLADASAVEFTRNPDAFISALQKLDSDDSEFSKANNATAHMFFTSPFKKVQKEKSDLLSTHPSISARIEAIKKLM